MIRKGIRPRFRLGIDRPGDSPGFRKVLPFRRSWIAIGILAALDAVFLFPAITTFQRVMAQWGKFDDLFDLTAALFLTAWLIGWSFAPLILTTLLALMLFGREVVKARHGAVELFIGLPVIGLSALYDPAKMRNLRVETPPPKSGKSWRGTHMVFDYGANTGEFGSDIGVLQLSLIHI